MLRDLLHLHKQIPDVIITIEPKDQAKKHIVTGKNIDGIIFLFNKLHYSFKNIQTGVGCFISSKFIE